MQIDGRTLGHETLETIRLMAVRRVRDGELPSQVIKSYGFCRTTIYKWLRIQAKGKSLKSTRGTGRPVRLTEAQKKRVRCWINGRDPRQYNFDFGLWTRKIVAQLIKEKMGIKLGVTSVGRLLAELDITPQKPLRRAYERDPKAIEQWTTQYYPRLRRRAKARGAELFFMDEAGIRSDAPPGRTWGLKGHTPVVATSGQRQSINAISAVNPRGAFWYETYSGRFNASLFLEFLKRFMKRRRKSIFLIVDGHPSHRAKVISKFIQDQAGKIELHFLPGYAPDLNPDEFVWNHIKTHGISKKPLKQNESLRRRINRDLVNIKNDPALVRSFFYAPSVAYVMD